MPEGDTIFKAARALRGYLLGQRVEAAWSQRSGPGTRALVGSRVTSVESLGKHLILLFDNGFALRTHLRMTGSWHRYEPGERWKKPRWQAQLVLEVPGSVLVCFNAPIVEVFSQKALPSHPSLRQLGPDLLDPQFDVEMVLERVESQSLPDATVADLLLDQRLLAGVGNVFKSEVLFIERVHPWTPVRGLSREHLTQLLLTSQRLLLANTRNDSYSRVTTEASPLARGSRLWVYRRAGRSCFRCGATIKTAVQGEQARRTFWCPRCQLAPDGAPEEPGG